MKNKNSIRSLENVALKTSFVTGLLFALPPFTILPFLIPAFLINVLFVSLLSFSIWTINISLVYASEKYKRIKIGNKLRHLLSYILNLLLVFIIYLCIKHFIHYLPDEYQQVLTLTPEEKRVFNLIVFIFLLNTVILIILESILLRNERILIELENTQLKLKNIEAFYNQLKQQIHPHFLFNSLNVLKTLIRKEPDVAEDYLVKLSDFLRASITSAKKNTVILQEELKLCTDYMEMQKLRFENALQYTINIPVDIQASGFVPAFSIQILLENAIKHNSLTNEMPLQIEISYSSGYITVCNNYQKKLTTGSSTGLGLKNLSERYIILSDEDISVEANEKEFSVKIKVLADENSNN